MLRLLHEQLNVWHSKDGRKKLVQLLLAQGFCSNLEVEFRSKDGVLLTGLVSAHLMMLDGVQCILSIVRDIRDRKAAEERIQNLSFSDQLTGLPNRRLFMDRLGQALISSVRNQRLGALLFVDLDNFKTINDTLGHDQGDFFLIEVAERLKRCVQEGDTVARLGADEFLVLLEDLSANQQETAQQAEVISEKIISVLKQPYNFGGTAHHLTASIGVAVFGGQQEDVVEPLKRVELAMYQAKGAGRNTLRFFDPQMQAAVSARAELEAALRDAIENKQFLLNYQPQVMADGAITGVEALVRWHDPRRGIVSPGDFIPLAEESGLILQLGQWVLESACAQLRDWAGKPGLAHLSVSVNVSARQFHQDDFVDLVLSAIQNSGADPEKLKLEITESTLISNVEDVIFKMNVLKGIGVGFSLDDFGTGYSSLSYLKRLPLDQLKVDRGFVRDILVDANDAAIAKMIIALAGSMGLSVIAEGVETDTQREALAELGCLEYQGYLFGRPMPAQELAEFMRCVRPFPHPLAKKAALGN